MIGSANFDYLDQDTITMDTDNNQNNFKDIKHMYIFKRKTLEEFKKMALRHNIEFVY